MTKASNFGVAKDRHFTHRGFVSVKKVPEALQSCALIEYWSSKKEISPPMPHEIHRIFKIRMILLLLIIVGGKAWALDEFAGIKCGADIPKSLVGKRNSNERAAVLEERHRDLGLKDLGGTEISDRLFLASWQICGREYELLVNTKNGVIRDVLPFPPHSKTAPMFLGACKADGKEIPGTVVAVLDNSAGYNARDEKLGKTMLKATAAWKIDKTREKFTQQPTKTLTCPLGGIITVDGGP